MSKRKAIISIMMSTIMVNTSVIYSNASNLEQTYNSRATTKKMEVISSSNLNVRKGAGTKYSKIGSLKKGTIVNVFSISNGWAKIEFKNSVGYCSAQYLKAITINSNNNTNNNNSNSNTSSDSALTQTNEMRVKCDTLNVRSGASTKHSLLGKLYRGDKVTVVQSLSNGWVKINYKNKVGYVSNVNNKYLESISSNNTQESTNPNNPFVDISTNNKKEMISKVDDLNVRKGVGTKYDIIGKLNKGDVVIAIEELSNGWVKVEFNGVIGYVSNKNGAYLEHGLYLKDKESANDVIELIDSLESGINATYRERLLKARELYDALNTDAKALVYNYDILVAAEGKLPILNEIQLLINDIDALTDNIMPSDKATVSSLIARFDSIADEYKPAVSNSDKLIEAELEIFRLERIPSNITTCDVMDLIYALPTVSNIHYSNEGDVKYARSAFKMLTPAEQLHVLNIDKLNEVEAEWKRIDNGIKHVKAEIDKIPAIEKLTIKHKYLVDNARKAYDSSDKKITYHIDYMNYDHLVKAEEKLSQL